MSEVTDLVIPKALIEELVKFLPKEEQTTQTPNTITITNPVDLSTVKKTGLYGLSIETEVGRKLLLQLQDSPYDEQFYMKAVRVDPYHFAEIQTNYKGEQVIVFKRK